MDSENNSVPWRLNELFQKCPLIPKEKFSDFIYTQGCEGTGKMPVMACDLYSHMVSNPNLYKGTGTILPDYDHQYMSHLYPKEYAPRKNSIYFYYPPTVGDYLQHLRTRGQKQNCGEARKPMIAEVLNKLDLALETFGSKPIYSVMLNMGRPKGDGPFRDDYDFIDANAFLVGENTYFPCCKAVMIGKGPPACGHFRTNCRISQREAENHLNLLEKIHWGKYHQEGVMMALYKENLATKAIISEKRYWGRETYRVDSMDQGDYTDIQKFLQVSWGRYGHMNHEELQREAESYAEDLALRIQLCGGVVSAQSESLFHLRRFLVNNGQITQKEGDLDLALESFKRDVVDYLLDQKLGTAWSREIPIASKRPSASHGIGTPPELQRKLGIINQQHLDDEKNGNDSSGEQDDSRNDRVKAFLAGVF